ncbi:hypothetical protein [Comamonas badia]|uniref:hypothetical protein n=1 Tax=Comamonas badia TaxID=265291 RepID=UPI000425AC90|nr:hypothetical protein [Comamonas badia]
MSTTTIRLEDTLKERINTAAGQAGKTAHAFILEALERRVNQVEQDNAFEALAEERWARIRATGKTVDWEEAKTWITARANGTPAPKPGAH